MKANEILITYGTEIKMLTAELLEEADLASLIPSADTSIGIKPNLVDAVPASEGSTTHPEIVAALIEYLQHHGFRKISILESSWVGAKTADAFRVCGYEEISRTYGVPLLDMQKEKGIPTDCRGLTLSVCEPVKNIDFLINVPVLKGHCQTVMTCALKNMKGLIPNSEKRRFHALGLHDPIAHVNTAIHQDFILVDSICGDPNFEDGGHPFVTNRLYCAIDPVLCDIFGCGLLGHRPEEVRYLALAEALGVGSGDLKKAVIRHLHEPSGPVEIPRTDAVARLSDAVTEVESCSACYGYLMPALDRLERQGILKDLQENICVGQGFRKKTGKLGIGSCTSGFEHCVKGCPPTEAEIYEDLYRYITDRNLTYGE